MTDKPIISIPIDDSKFQKFFELFKQYSEKLDEQPAAWKKLNDAIVSVSPRMTPAVQKISGHFSDTADSSTEIAKSLSASTSAMQGLFAATQKSNAAMGELMASTTGVAKGLFDAGAGLLGLKKTLGLLGNIPGAGTAIKIAGAAVAAAAAVGDVTLRSANWSSDTARAAYGANATFGQYQNTVAQLSPFMSNPGASLQNIAAAQWNPGAQGALGLFGVTGGQTSQQAMATVMKQGVATLQATHNLALPQVTYAERLLGASPTDMISWANEPKRVMAAHISKMLNPSLSAQQNVSTAVVSKAQNLQSSWAMSMNTASAKFAAALAPFDPSVAKFGQFVAQMSTAINNGVQVTNKFLSEFGLIKNNLPPALGGLGNGPGGINPTTGQGNVPSTSPSPYGNSGQSLAGKTNFRAVMKMFEAAGYSNKFAAAMAAQAGSESGFDASQINITKGQKHAGLFQWSKTRHDQILAGFGVNVWTDLNPQDQVAASIWELRHTQKMAAAKIAAAAAGRTGSAGAAAIAADKYYEVSGDNQFQQAVRGLKANVFSAIGPSPTTPGVSVDSPEVLALLKRLAKQNLIKVHAVVTNSTSAKVAMSANAAVN